MASRGRQTFNKRLKEQQRKEKQQEKFARRLQRKDETDRTGKGPEMGEPIELEPLTDEEENALSINIEKSAQI